MCQWWHPWKDNCISHWSTCGWLFNLPSNTTTQRPLLSWLGYSIAEKQKNPITRGHTQDMITAFPFNCLYLERQCSKQLVHGNPPWRQRLKPDLGFLQKKGRDTCMEATGGSQYVEVSQWSLLLKVAMKTQEEYWIHFSILDNTP